jgi:hypothetical protein
MRFLGRKWGKKNATAKIKAIFSRSPFGLRRCSAERRTEIKTPLCLILAVRVEFAASKI